MPNYNNSKIYKIVVNTNGNIYIGSTTQALSMRLCGHVSDYKKWVNGNKHYVTSFEIIKNGDYTIVSIEELACETKEQLLKTERLHIESNVCVNKQIPTRTPQEHYQDNKEKINEKNKQYYEDHKEEIREYSKTYREENKEQIKESKKEYQQNNKERLNAISKKYREEHTDEMKEYKKEHYIKNKEKIQERVNEKITCVCGCLQNRSNMARHMKTKAHLDKMETITDL